MGYGDNIMATGMARGARARGVRIAFGDQVERRIRWDHNSEQVFRFNPNIAPLGSESDRDLEWVRFYVGSRLYNQHDVPNNRWRWRRSFKARPGQVFLSPEEMAWADSAGQGFVLIEPNVPNWKTVAPNKQWPVERFQAVAHRLKAAGHEVAQLSFGERYVLDGVRRIPTKTFRHGIAALARAACAILPEGGLHHAAAAQILSAPTPEAPEGIVLRERTPAVVIFGGFIPPEVTGYDFHRNLAAPGNACGSIKPCEHCREAMAQISIEQVWTSAMEILGSGT